MSVRSDKVGIWLRMENKEVEKKLQEKKLQEKKKVEKKLQEKKEMEKKEVLIDFANSTDHEFTVKVHDQCHLLVKTKIKSLLLQTSELRSEISTNTCSCGSV